VIDVNAYEFVRGSKYSLLEENLLFFQVFFHSSLVIKAV